MEATNKLIKLSSEKGIFKGGFAALTTTQLLRLKGGSGEGGNNCICGGNNCKCGGNNCNCY